MTTTHAGSAVVAAVEHVAVEAEPALERLRLDIEGQVCACATEFYQFAEQGLSYPADEVQHYTELIMQHVKWYLGEAGQ